VAAKSFEYPEGIAQLGLGPLDGKTARAPLRLRQQAD